LGWFQIERQLVVTTGEKLAEVGRIDQNEAEPEAEPLTEPEPNNTMQPGLLPSEWSDDHRLVISPSHPLNLISMVIEFA